MTKRIKEKGLLNLKGTNKLVKKVKKQMPKKQKDQLSGPLPNEGTGINVIIGTSYKKKK